MNDIFYPIHHQSFRFTNNEKLSEEGLREKIIAIRLNQRGNHSKYPRSRMFGNEVFKIGEDLWFLIEEVNEEYYQLSFQSRDNKRPVLFVVILFFGLGALFSSFIRSILIPTAIFFGAVFLMFHFISKATTQNFALYAHRLANELDSIAQKK